MNLTEDQLDRIKRLSKAWADAEEALKISEQQVGDVVIPAIKELRYAGRKLTKGLENYRQGVRVPETDREIEDAIFDCYRARHDATDAATSAITLRLDLAMRRLGAKTVRAEFPEYADLMSHLVVVRRKVAGARKDGNGRHDLYEELETGELPKIVAFYEKFKIVEPLMKNRTFWNFLRDQGITIGGMLALFFAYLALK
jgi:hypothetical protein